MGQWTTFVQDVGSLLGGHRLVKRNDDHRVMVSAILGNRPLRRMWTFKGVRSSGETTVAAFSYLNAVHRVDADLRVVGRFAAQVQQSGAKILHSPNHLLVADPDVAFLRLLMVAKAVAILGHLRSIVNDVQTSLQRWKKRIHIFFLD